MSGTRGIFNEGYPGHYSDMQRVADQAAGAADEVWGGLAAPGGVMRRAYDDGSTAASDRNIIPLLDEGNTSLGVLQQLLVKPSGATTGKVTVLPAIYQVAGPTDTSAVLDGYADQPLLTARRRTHIESAKFASNASGDTRIDLVYATIARSVSVTAARPKRTASGISTQTLDLASDPAVTVTILAGTPAAAGPAVPADGASAYNFPLAYVTLLDGYVEGDAIPADKIKQIWTRGGIRQDRMAAIIGGGASGGAALITSRTTARQHAYCPVAHSTNPQTFQLLGGTYQGDMRQRVVRVRGIRPKLDTTYKAPEKVTKGGADTTHAGSFDTGLVFTGTDGAAASPAYSVDLTAAANGGGVGVGSNDLRVQIYADSSTGALSMKLTGNPWGASDYWWIEVDFSGSLQNIRND